MRQMLGGVAVGAVLLALTPVVLAQTRPLNDSGQIACYSDTAGTGTVGSSTPDPESAGFNEQDCTRGRAAADAVGVLSKVGASSVPGRDYTKIANDGSVLPASAALGMAPGDWGCTRDNVTGLIWEIKTDDDGLRDKDHAYGWYDTNLAINGGIAGSIFDTASCGGTLTNCNTTAFRDAVNALAGASRLCGQTDWRLPTGKELMSLVTYGEFSLTRIDAVFFPNTFTNSYNWWSGVTYARFPDGAWYVDIYDGLLSFTFKDSGMRVRLVRGGQ